MAWQIADQGVVPRFEDEVQRPRLARGYPIDLTDGAALTRLLALEQVARRLCRLRDDEPDLALRCPLGPREDAELVDLDGHEGLRGHGVPSRDGAGNGDDCDDRDPKSELSHFHRLPSSCWMLSSVAY